MGALIAGTTFFHQVLRFASLLGAAGLLGIKHGLQGPAPLPKLTSASRLVPRCPSTAPGSGATQAACHARWPRRHPTSPPAPPSRHTPCERSPHRAARVPHPSPRSQHQAPSLAPFLGPRAAPANLLARSGSGTGLLETMLQLQRRSTSVECKAEHVKRERARTSQGRTQTPPSHAGEACHPAPPPPRSGRPPGPRARKAWRGGGGGDALPPSPDGRIDEHGPGWWQRLFTRSARLQR